MEQQKHFKLALLNVNKFVEVNELKPISNPIFFASNGLPTVDGLLSNDIFGISKDERSNIYGYIDLYQDFINPLIYKTWCRMDSKIRDCVHGVKKFTIDSEGQLVEDENGQSGVKFIKDNINKIKIQETDSTKRTTNINFIKESKDALFISKYPVIPAFYRDVNTSEAKMGVGEINKMYNSLIISVRALKETADYGLSLSDAVTGRIQEMLVTIYNWFTAEPNLGKKKGIMKRSIMSKTTDYSARLVISSPDINVERYDDLMVDMEYSAAPLSACIVTLYPFMLFHIRRFFENEFAGGKYPVMNPKTKEIDYVTISDYQIHFSDEHIKHEMDRFIKGYSNRFIPIEVPNEEGKTVFMRFKGRHVDPKTMKGNEILDRRLTWCDIFFIAANEAVKGKSGLITRYPMESYLNQFNTMIRVNSTIKKEIVMINNEIYRWYPSIEEKDIGTNTADLFVDTLQISNVYLEAIGGDYDGDQVTLKVAYLEESNKELIDNIYSLKNFVDLSGKIMRNSTNEAVQAIYSLTRCYDMSKLTNPTY